MSTSSAVHVALDPDARHPAIQAWVDEMVAHLQPEKIHWVDGSVEERSELMAQAVRQGILIPLNPATMPGCYYHRSHPSDVARVEDRTFICTTTEADAGPTNHWVEPSAMRAQLMALLAGSYRGRTLYVIPYLMGPAGCPRTMVGVEITDSLYVVLSMGVMTRMGAIALRELTLQEAATGHVVFNRGLHGTLDLDPAKRYIAHFPQDNAIISTASNYGGNVLLGKKCLALRIGSWLGNQQGWLAEHMLIMKVESPRGEVTFVAAAFPSACGKTNFAMIVPPQEFAGWKITTVGDDIAWMWIDEAGHLRAMNPENGYFGVAPGTNSATNPNAMATISHDTLYTNVAQTHDGGVWWEGHDGAQPVECIDWKGQPWTNHDEHKAAHPNSRFAAPMTNNPALAPEATDPAGVPISALIFGGRRASTFPLVFQAFNWAHGVYLGATMGSEMTAAAAGTIGTVRRDPMAMLPFCGYHMGDYFAHWLAMGRKLKHPPRIFHVNWFRKDASGRFLWPGFGDNMRVLQWVVNRCHGHAEGEETALGWMPPLDSIDLNGLANYSRERLAEAQAINPVEWHAELALQNDLFNSLGERMPKDLLYERELLRSRLG